MYWWLHSFFTGVIREKVIGNWWTLSGPQIILKYDKNTYKFESILRIKSNKVQNYFIFINSNDKVDAADYRSTFEKLST